MKLKMPEKKVRFDSNVVTHYMIYWNYAYRLARIGPWQIFAIDRCRFKRRIEESEKLIAPVFSEQHRESILKRIS